MATSWRRRTSSTSDALPPRDCSHRQQQAPTSSLALSFLPFASSSSATLLGTALAAATAASLHSLHPPPSSTKLGTAAACLLRTLTHSRHLTMQRRFPLPMHKAPLARTHPAVSMHRAWPALPRSTAQPFSAPRPPWTSGSAFSTAAPAPLTWHRSRQYLQYVNKCMADSVSPYWHALQWSTLQAITQRATQYLPSIPGAARFHLPVLSALNIVGSNLPRTFAFILVEALRSARAARAHSFDAFSSTLAVEAWAETLSSHQAWWWLLLSETASAMWHLVRLGWLLMVFAPVIVTAPLALTWGVQRERWMAMLRHSLENGGAFFIKWGQWAATRHDIFPPDMCKELSMLHTQAPAHGFYHTKRALERAFSMTLADMFEYLEQRPVASGSIGQIHRARLSRKGAAITGCTPGQVVAVKVRHPGTADTILDDFETMLWIAHVANFLPALGHLRLEETLKQFAAPLKEQVDLAREASNLQRFNYNFRRTDHVRFPVPLYPLVSADVLVESFEEGDHITSYIESHNNPYNHRLSELGSGTMLQMMLVDNLIHSDLHPGNILVRLNPPNGLLGLLYKVLDKVKDSTKLSAAVQGRIQSLQRRWLQPQIVLLDVGMATEMNDEDQVNMVGLFRSFAKMDGRACGEWTLRFSGAEQSCPNPEAFRAAMQNTFDLMRLAEEQSKEHDEVVFRNNAEALSSVLELIRQYQVSLPGHICAAVVTTLVLEGWSSKLDPDHSVMTQVQKMFEGANVPWRERILTVVDYVMEDEDNSCLV